MKHLELFAGIGGFRRAIELIGNDLRIPMNCIGFSEIDNKAILTYKANFKVRNGEMCIGDIVDFTAETNNIANLPDFDLLTAGFPCQSFSMMGEQQGFSDKSRGQMFFRIIDVLQVKRPPYFLLENVKNLKTHNHGNTFRVIVSELERLGYSVYCDVFNTNDYHLAQIRNRVFIFGSLNSPKGLQFTSEAICAHFETIYKKTKLEKQKTVLDVLEKSVDRKYFLSDRIKPTILSDGCGGFKSKSDINKIQARPLTATMHKMHRACQDNYYSQNFIDSNGKDNPVEYASKEELAQLEIRKLTPKEAMLLQGFSATWATNAQKAGVVDGALYKQAGNAVSVNVVYAILRYLIDKNIIEI